MLAKAFFSLFLFIFILPAAHAGIYRWVDEKGQTQFSDRPVDNKTQKVKVDTQHNSYGGGGVLERQKGLLDEYQAKDAQQLRNKKQAEKEAAQAQRLEARCINAKDRLKNFKKGALYRLDKKGERIYYSEEKRSKAIDKYQQAIEKNC